MKLINLILPAVFLCTSCHHEKEIRAVTYAPVGVGTCTDDAANRYHYSLPVQHNGNLPLLIVLDSHGDGLLAVNKTLPAVADIPCLVVGSDLVRNNYPDYLNAIRTLINDVQQKFKVSGVVYLSGFSGGARMALDYAIRSPVNGVLMCGAGMDMRALQNLTFPVYMIAGTTDFNFGETYYNPLQKPAQLKFLADYFRGKHEWPPADMMKDGLLFLMGKSIPQGEALLKQESELLAEKADSLEAGGESLYTLKALEKALALYPDNKQAKKHLQELSHNQKLISKIDRIESDLTLEGRINQAYASASADKDSLWWANEIKQLSNEINNHTGDQQDHLMRVKAFLGIMFYSRLNTLIRTEPNNPQIIHLLAAYKSIEPDNPDVYYDYALYAFRKGNSGKVKECLSKAWSLGFSDHAKMDSDFPGMNLKK